METVGEKKPPFRVVIAGGGIAGLTLANCFERAGSKSHPIEDFYVIALEAIASHRLEYY